MRRLNSPHQNDAAKVLFEYDFDSAEEEFKRALEIDSRSFEAHLYYAGFLSMMERHDEALSHINLAVEIDRFSTLAEERKINILYNAGNKSEALKAIEKFTDSNPSNPGGFSKRAIYYSHMGWYEEAISMLNILDLQHVMSVSKCYLYSFCVISIEATTSPSLMVT